MACSFKRPNLLVLTKKLLTTVQYVEEEVTPYIGCSKMSTPYDSYYNYTKEKPLDNQVSYRKQQNKKTTIGLHKSGFSFCEKNIIARNTYLTQAYDIDPISLDKLISVLKLDKENIQRAKMIHPDRVYLACYALYFISKYHPKKRILDHTKYCLWLIWKSAEALVEIFQEACTYAKETQVKPIKEAFEIKLQSLSNLSKCPRYKKILFSIRSRFLSEYGETITNKILQDYYFRFNEKDSGCLTIIYQNNKNKINHFKNYYQKFFLKELNRHATNVKFQFNEIS